LALNGCTLVLIRDMDASSGDGLVG
jgi:hypothetical protein